MRIALFCHSILSDWNHGNAHFLRGLASELVARGNDVRIWEPRDAWSMGNLVRDHGEGPLAEVRRVYPALDVTRYDRRELDLDAALSGTDVVIVHEWSDHDLVRRIGEARERLGYLLLFHDTHHRSVTDEASMSEYDLSRYDGVLAFGGVIRDLYLRKGWARRAYAFHEAADARVFTPRPELRPEVDLVWIGNWGDDEREAELHEFLLGPVKRLGLSARVHGVRYPERGIAALRDAGIEYCGWLPNHRVPQAFARARATVHVPRRPYAVRLPGIPTIRPFEALACGIPLVSAPWQDSEGIFRANEDLLFAKDGEETCAHLDRILTRPEIACTLAASGRERVLARHTCAHRADELLSIVDTVQRERRTTTSSATTC
ncbi:MAG: glycosyltransferase [Myxococcota bacterium]|nr:glycosyltransferase [Myxococcota bacterium]